ncbi:DsbA family protein, partial [Pseudomonas aeruginosa]
EGFHPYLKAVFEALCVRHQNLCKPEVVAQVFAEAGFDPDEFLRLVGDEQVMVCLKATTEDAVRRCVFGAPSFFVGDQLFF